jgi:hypothetical protein
LGARLEHNDYTGFEVQPDARLGWRLAESIELSVAGQNLLGPRHFELGQACWLHATQARRSVYGKIT